MKADTIRLATVFHEAGMIDEPTYEQCKEVSDPKAKSFADALKKVTQNVSFKNIGELMTADIVPSGKKSNDSTLHDILSQPLFLSQDQIRSILCAWKPSVGDLVTRLNACGIMPDGTTEAVKELGRGAAAYDRLIERGYLDSNSVNRVVSANHLPHKRMNRLLLALNCLKHNGMLSQGDCDLLLQKIEEKGESQIPVLNQEILDFIGSDPELPELNLAEVEPIDTLRKMLPSGFIRQSLVLPRQRVKSVLEIVTSDPFHFTLIDSLSFLTGVSISVYHASTSQLISRINAIYPTGDASTASHAAQPSLAAAQPAIGATSDVGGSAPVLEEIADNRTTVGLVTSIIEGGVKHKATDIHLEPQADGKLRVRYRIDGRLREVMDVPPEMMLSVVSRIKVLSNLDVTERRRPQDGHFSLRIGEGAFDFRVSSLPTHVGEKVVIRILDESRVMLSLASLGMETDQAGMVAKWISRPHGLVLVTGPTGSARHQPFMHRSIPSTPPKKTSSPLKIRSNTR